MSDSAAASAETQRLASIAQAVTQAPERFYRPDEELAATLRTAAKLAFDAGAKLSHVPVPLPELYVEGFDTDQIWEELEVQHKGSLGKLDKRLDVLLGKVDQVSLPRALVPASPVGGQDPISAHSSDASSDEGSEGEEDDGSSVSSSGSSTGDHDGGVPGEEELVDFVADMDAFDEAHQGLALGDMGADEELDYSAPMSSSDRNKAVMYEDFFGPRPGAGGKAGRGGDSLGEGGLDENEGIAALGGAESDEEDAIVNTLHTLPGMEEEEEEEEDEDSGIDDGGAVGTSAGLHFPTRTERAPEPEVLSTFQRRQAALAEEVAALEEAAVAPKVWEMSGEVQARARPTNSLLDATLDTEARRKLAPVITPAATDSLESLIKQRITDEAWDDVTRRVLEGELGDIKKPLPDVATGGDRAGLGDVYAKEYAARVMGVKEETEADVAEKEARGLWAALSRNLDALTNAHFTPAAPDTAIAVKADVPAVALEEALPGSLTTAAALAPEEVHAPVRGHGMAGGELTPAQRKAARRAAKTASRKRRREDSAQAVLRAAADPRQANKAAAQRMAEELGRNKSVSLASQRGAGSASAPGGLAAVATSGHIKSGQLFTALQAEAQSKIARLAGSGASATTGRSAGGEDDAALRRSKKKKGKSARGASRSAATGHRL